MKVFILEKERFKSKYCGVYGVKRSDGEIYWQVERTINGKKVYGEVFKVEEDAAKASDDLILDHLKRGGKLRQKMKLNIRKAKQLNFGKKGREKFKSTSFFLITCTCFALHKILKF